jgi:UDP-N-acetylmuramate--alanine ligase
LRAARPVAGEGRIIAVFQPHLFSRTRIFAEEFGVALGLADEVVVLEVYPAREDPEPGVTGALICDTVPLPGARVTFVPGREQGLERAATVVAARCRAGDLVLTIGAGDVTELGPMVLSRLRSAS